MSTLAARLTLLFSQVIRPGICKLWSKSESVVESSNRVLHLSRMQPCASPMLR